MTIYQNFKYNIGTKVKKSKRFEHKTTFLDTQTFPPSHRHLQDFFHRLPGGLELKKGKLKNKHAWFAAYDLETFDIWKIMFGPPM